MCVMMRRGCRVGLDAKPHISTAHSFDYPGRRGVLGVLPDREKGDIGGSWLQRGSRVMQKRPGVVQFGFGGCVRAMHIVLAYS